VPEQRASALARVGAIVEEPRFHSHLTGRENLRANATARGGQAAARIGGALERVGLRERADARGKTYSMGMRQRLGIARCLLADPALLILDEPMNGLDPAGILEFRSLIREFVDEGRTVFLSSHLLDEVERTCDMVAIVDQGRIVRQGPIADIGGGDGPTLAIVCDDADAAVAVLAQRRDVESTDKQDGALRVVLAAGADPAEVNRALVVAGIGVRRLEPTRISLEERFLELTSSLGGQA
jgi:ABC-2 type transport system ATP-binding protein